ncbi:SAM-dependent methyltransferase [Blastococcus sp. SYSU D00813]
MLSARLAEVVAALPLRPGMRVLEVGCGPGAAARAIAARVPGGHVLAVDRSATAIRQLVAGSAAELRSGRLSARQAAVEEFELLPGEEPFDLVVAIRVGALDGRHPEAGRRAMARLAAATVPTARLFTDGGDPLLSRPIHPAVSPGGRG